MSLLKVKELRGSSSPFTLIDGSTFRIRARETKYLDSTLVSEEMRRAEQRSFISITEVVEDSDERVNVGEGSPTVYVEETVEAEVEDIAPVSGTKSSKLKKKEKQEGGV